VSNPFSGIITSEFLTTFDNMISAVLEQSALTRECKLIYSNTKMSECPNCIYDVATKKSSGRYKGGGPRPFDNGQICPVCLGYYSIPSENYETLYLACIFDSKKFVQYPGIQTSDIKVQTMSSINTLAKLKKVKEIIIDVGVQPYITLRCQKMAEPELMGLGSSAFIIIPWKKV